jgi:hypothetical protein
MRRRDFVKHSQILQTITPSDIKKAAEEEKEGKCISNFAVRLLMKSIHAVA